MLPIRSLRRLLLTRRSHEERSAVGKRQVQAELRGFPRQFVARVGLGRSRLTGRNALDGESREPQDASIVGNPHACRVARSRRGTARNAVFTCNVVATREIR